MPDSGFSHTVLSMSDHEAQQRTIRVLVVDDNDVFRTGLSSLLSLEPDIEVVAQASGGRMGLRLAEELRPDVVLMDLRMPDLRGSDATRAIVQGNPEARVVVLTVASGDEDIEVSLEAGACGFLAKETPIGEVVAAIRAAAHGAAWLAPRAADVVLGHLRRERAEPEPDRNRTKDLSPREVEVLRLIARGMDNAQIAEALNISPRTAKNHVSSILTKLGVTGRVQAAVYAVRRGLA